MFLRRLQVDRLRCLERVDLHLAPGLNTFVGHNGAGKTSLLEAVFLLSHGRSFRPGGVDALLKRNADAFDVYAEVQHRQGKTSRVGLGRRQQRWQVRVDGEARAGLADLLGQCAVVCFEPGTHELIAGASEQRRRFLDWGVFHVEHSFLHAWRRYQRALRQRNALLRAGRGGMDPLRAFDLELDAAGTAVDRHRATYVERFVQVFRAELMRFVPELGSVQMQYWRGWGADCTLLDDLQARRERDMQRGHTTAGAHRADWSLVFAHAPVREHLSRGQEKLVGLAAILAQTELYAADHEEWPVVCVDDLASELDTAHQEAVVSRLLQCGAQMLVTGTGLAAGINARSARMFHVEQGRARVAAAT